MKATFGGEPVKFMGTTRAARSRAPALARYALAIILVAFALLISLALRNSFGNPFWFFFSVAVILSTWFGRTGPGWVSVFCSTLAVMYYFTPPVHSFAVKPGELPYFITFMACEVGATQLISWRRRSEDALRQARDELEARVAERTIELKNANDALLKQMEEQRRTEEMLQTTRAELARAARITTMGELTASIAHEVNQPLAAVVANADACVAWLSREAPDLAEARAAAERATEGATRASDVIARIRSLITKATPQKSRVEINRIIEQTAVLAEAQATKNNVAMKLELQPDLPFVLGDGIQLQQVIMNLVMNGIEAMTTVTDRPRTLTLLSESQNGDQVRVAVHDAGIGLSDEVNKRLFEPFFTTRTKGMGMGLSISRSIIEAHGGRLWAEPNGLSGSTFQFTLPKGDLHAA
jgi:C4-dicarboxylate-specific signal transduction histidine kinase